MVIMLIPFNSQLLINTCAIQIFHPKIFVFSSANLDSEGISKMQSIHDISLMTSLGLKSNITTPSTDKTFNYQRGLENYDSSKPILVVLHGYPQT
jgi:hypothetical protein